MLILVVLHEVVIKVLELIQLAQLRLLELQGWLFGFFSLLNCISYFHLNPVGLVLLICYILNAERLNRFRT